MTKNPPNGAADATALAQELRGFVSKLKRRLRAQANVGDLTPSQVGVLLRLERDGPQTTSGLARAEGMRPQSMRTIVGALQEADLVIGAPDPADGRQTNLMLSDACRAWLTAGRTARQDWLTAVLQDRLTPEERRQLGTVLPLLRRLADE